MRSRSIVPGDVKNKFERAKQAKIRLVKQVVLSTLNYVVLVSPVDTGRYRGAHSLAPNKPRKTKTAKATKVNPPSATLFDGEKVLGTVFDSVEKKKIYLYNPLIYAWPIEFGHSKQAPNGVYTRAHMRAKKQWKELARKNKGIRK